MTPDSVADALPRLLPGAAVGSVGSLPFDNCKQALDFLARWTPEWPTWPQLPARSPRENMIAQFLARVDFFSPRNAARTAFCWPRDVPPERLTNCPSNLEDESSAGFRAFCESAATQLPHTPVWRGQMTGPLTLASALFDEDGAPLLASDTHLAALGEYVARSAAWQIRCLRKCLPNDRPVLLTVDEPLLLALKPFDERWKVVREVLASVVAAIHAEGADAGVHCCAATDWSAALALPWDVVSVDAAGFWQSIVAHRSAFEAFIARGGTVAWGAVATDFAGDADDWAKEFTARLAAIWPDNLDRLVAQSVVTPACGLGRCTPPQAERVMETCHRVAEEMQRVAATGLP